MDIRATQTKLASLGYNPGAVDGDAGPKTMTALLCAVGNRKPTPLIQTIGKSCAEYFPKYGFLTRLRLAHFLSQCAAETGGFSALEENLNYSAKRLTQVWPKRFKTLDAAAPFAMNPEALANKTYGFRMGNSQPGDGWRFRGRGIKMLTGRDNYTLFAAKTKLDLVKNPDLAADPHFSVLIACEFWKVNNIFPFADTDNLQRVTIAINGGLIGFELRAHYLKRAKDVLL